MNNTQLLYNIGVQADNKKNHINSLSNEITKLVKKHKEIHQAGQIDKKTNQRKETLLEYRIKLDNTVNKVSNCRNKLKLLTGKNKFVKTPLAQISETSGTTSEPSSGTTSGTISGTTSEPHREPISGTISEPTSGTISEPTDINSAIQKSNRACCML